MTTTAITPPKTMEDLDKRLADAKREHREAKRALGTAVVEGAPQAAAEARVRDAAASVDALLAAKSALRGRLLAAAEEERVRQGHVDRWASAHKLLTYVREVRPILELQAKLKAAEQRIGRNDLRRLPQLPDAMVAEVAAEAGESTSYCHLPDLTMENGEVRTGWLTPEVCVAWEGYLERLVERHAAGARETGVSDEELDEGQLPWVRVGEAS